MKFRQRLSKWAFGEKPPSRKAWMWCAGICLALSILTGLGPAARDFQTQIAHGTGVLTALGEVIALQAVFALFWLMMGALMFVYFYRIIPEFWQMLQEIWRGICMIPDAVRACRRFICACGRALRTSWRFAGTIPARIGKGIARWRALSSKDKGFAIVMSISFCLAAAVEYGGWLVAGWIIPHLPHWMQSDGLEERLIIGVFVSIVPLAIVMTMAMHIGVAAVKRLTKN
ncbi:MAG: hypothetical protein ACRD3W_04975 [Terriglobales bacterium]